MQTRAATKVPAIVLGTLACAGLLWQMYFEGSEVAAGGSMSTQFRVVFWAQIASVVLLIVGIIFATIRGAQLVSLALGAACLATLCPLWIAMSAFWPSGWSRWMRALKAFPLETGERLLLAALPAILAVVLCGYLFNRLRAVRVA